MIKGLLFDVFGVLYPGTYNEFAAKHAPELSREDQAKLYELHTRSNRGQIDIPAAVEQMSQLTGVTGSSIHYELYEKDPINMDLIKLIAKLKSTYRIGILSNVGEGFIEGFLSQHDIEQYFDSITLSCRIGFVKPESESYRSAADALNTPVDECLMIDDKQRHIDGALAIGMPGLLYKDFPQLQYDLKQLLNRVD